MQSTTFRPKTRFRFLFENGDLFTVLFGVLPNVTLSRTRHGCRHANLVSFLGVTHCDPNSSPPPPTPPSKNPSYFPALLI